MPLRILKHISRSLPLARSAVSRRTLMVVLALGLAACGSSHTGEGDGGDGVCCPVTDFEGCSPGDNQPGGGWAASLDECTYMIGGYDGRPFERVTDEHGCARVEQAATGCCGCVPDAGPPDAGPPDGGNSACDGLGPAACSASSECAPVFDNACCPTCTSGACADCIDPVYEGCRPFDGCRSAMCGEVPGWLCFPIGPDCSMATVVSDSACDRVGCVPATAPVGEPSTMGLCRPITRDSCTTTCRRLPPDCPAGTVPEGDGSCYTDLCIPAFVCE